MNWKLVNQVLETRFANEFLYWDRTGLVAKKLVEKFPRLELINATPGETLLKDNELGVDLRYSYKIAHAIQNCMYAPQKEFAEYVSFFFPFFFRAIEVSNITRVGNRFTYHREFDSAAGSKEAFTAITQKHAMAANFLASAEDDNLKEKRLSQVALRFTDDKIGIRVEIGTVATGFSLNGPTPPGLQEHLPAKRYALQLDADVYTLQSMRCEDLVVDDFVQSNRRMLETRILPLLGK